MAPPQRVRVLRCSCCRLFQAHQVKKSLKWTCKACGEKQSFLREKLQPSKNRWLKYLERDSKELQLEEGGVCFNRQPSSKREKPDPPFSTGLPRKRKWSQSTVQPSCSPNIQDSRNCEVTLKSLKDHTGLTGKVKEGSSREDWDTRELVVPRGEPPCPAQKVRTVSPKWEQFLLPLGNSSHLDTEPLTPLQRGPRPARAAWTQQGTPRTQTPREGLCRTLGALQLPQATHTPTPGPKRLCGKTPEQSGGTGPWAEGGALVKGMQEPSSLLRLCDLFKTGEDFDDHL
uniref:MRN complex interacting protein n=1 Tax=Monodon monoceros TaxID=40151 RepID=A0A8C6AQ16_MONMO